MNRELYLTVGRLTDRGRVRERNEDFVGGPEGIPPEKLKQKGRLYVVADGMGGHLGGQRAAQLAVERVIQEYYRDPSLDIPGSLERAIKLANAEIYSEAARNPAYKGMGSTIVAAVVRGDDLYVANVGDSRAYLVRGSSIQQITRDHSWIAEALRAGTITPEQALTHPNRGVITRSLGAGPDVRVDRFHRKIRPGDVILLCSDGLTNVVSDADIQKVVTRERPQRAANKLIAMANQGGGPDNIAAIVIGVQRVPGAAPAAIRRAKGRRSLAPWVAATAALALVLAVIMLTSYFRLPSSGTGTTTPGAEEGPVAKVESGQTPAVASPPPSPAIPATATPVLIKPSPPITSSIEVTLTHTPTPTPARAVPSPTPLPTVALLEPPDGATLNRNFFLRWKWEGELGPDEHFDVRVWREGKPHYGITWTKDPEYLLGPDLKRGKYYWSIAIVRGRDGKVQEEVVPEGAIRTFTWVGGTRPPKPPTPTPAPPTPTPWR